MLALKKKREAQRKAAEEAAKAEAAAPTVSAPADGAAAEGAAAGGQVSLFGIGGQKKEKEGRADGDEEVSGRNTDPKRYRGTRRRKSCLGDLPETKRSYQFQRFDNSRYRLLEGSYL
mmetsp:Transcript_20162/g.45893  ORF Transcript_20162/g.45893 Transcript_20162/m.45893 type:complete len:117 (+) Transcript_20162:92-442(+)